MNELPHFLTRYRLALFFLLSYLLSWWLLPVARQGMLPQGPALAAVIVIALTAGKTGLREWWSRVTNFRGGWWYLAGPAILAGALAAAFVINVLLGASVSRPPQLSLVVAGVLLLFGGEWEELGWSGYALPALQERFAGARHGALIATLVLGVFRAIWHLPLVIVGAIPWYEAILVNILVFQPIISWLYNKSGGSVPVVWVFHFASNLLAAIVSPVFVGPEKIQYMMLFYALGFLAAATLAWGSGFEFGQRGAVPRAT